MTLGVSSSFSDKSINLHDRASVESVQVYIMQLPTKARRNFLQLTIKTNYFQYIYMRCQQVDINGVMLTDIILHIGDRSYGTIVLRLNTFIYFAPD